MTNHNLSNPQRWRVPVARLAMVLCALAFLAGAVTRAVAQERWLLVFDTSETMKKRLPAIEASIKPFFASNFGGNLHAGDSIGVWTYDKTLHTGDYPLFQWQPEDAVNTETNLMKFLGERTYKGESDMDALEPILDRVIGHSERLTVVIFCSGDGQVNWTPYNDGVNQNLSSGAEERAKHKLPVVMVVRTQQGKYVGVTVNYPPLVPAIPVFPPLPQPVKPAPQVVAPPPRPPQPPVVTLPSLVVVGTSVSTDLNATVRFEETNHIVHPVAAPANLPTNAVNETPPPGTSATDDAANLINSAPAANPAPNTIPNPAANTARNAIATATPNATSTSAPVAENNPPATNVVSATTDDGGERGTMFLVILGSFLFGAAAVLVLWLLLRRRRPQTSLITSLMADDPRYRK